MICASTTSRTGQTIFGIVYRLFVVLSDTVNTFKTKLDKFWQDQPIIFDFKTEIHGTGSPSWY